LVQREKAQGEKRDAGQRVENNKCKKEEKKGTMGLRKDEGESKSITHVKKDRKMMEEEGGEKVGKSQKGEGPGLHTTQ